MTNSMAELAEKLRDTVMHNAGVRDEYQDWTDVREDFDKIIAALRGSSEPAKVDWDALEQAKKADAAAFANTWGEIKPHTSEPLPCAPDPRDAVIAELTKWADDWAVYRGPAEKPVDKGWRLAAEELQSILKKSATRTFE